MAKVKVSYRLDENTIARLEKLVNFYSLHSPARDDLPGQKVTLTKTDIIDFVVTRAYEKLIADGYDL